MSLSALAPLPSTSGAYRWFYADVSAGDYSAVCIFMVGSLFSPRYSVAARRGGRPREHCAINFALYHQGRRERWVLSEYSRVEQVDARCLRIGRSTLRYEDGGTVRMEVDERTAPWGRPVRASLVLEPLTPSVDELQLVPGLPHYWQALAPRTRAWLKVASEGLEAEGMGYHDTNHGEELLGQRLAGWHWTRTHRAEVTVVDYHLPDGVPPVRVTAHPDGVSCERGTVVPPEARPMSLTGWGLRVPSRLHAGNVVLGEPKLLESSPFYARVEARVHGFDALGEVADFRRFHSPLIRWMAHFRTRVESES